MRKINLGSGGHLLPGFENLDYNPCIASKDPIYIIHDLRKPLPYQNNAVSFIYSEHFIEHLDELDGFNLMKECFRVLTPGGVLRFSCPDLRKYIESYLNWDADTNVDKKFFSSGANYLNYAMVGEAREGIKYLSLIKASKDEGHRYYYDEPELTKKLVMSGFNSIKRCAWGKSDWPEFVGVEWRPPMRDLIVEAIKP